MTATANLFAAPANRFAANAVAFIEGAKASATLATPFSRSLLAALVGGTASASMLESMVLSAAGSPHSPKTGKLIAKVSGLRDAIEAGDAIRKAWENTLFVFDNIDADAWLIAPTDESEGQPGAAAIRPLVEAFILESEGAEKALGTPHSGLRGKVQAAIRAHTDAIALLHNVEPEKAEGETAPEAEGGETAPAATSPVDMVNAMLVRLRSMTDADFVAAQAELAMLSDYVDSRWNAIAEQEEEEVQAA